MKNLSPTYIKFLDKKYKYLCLKFKLLNKTCLILDICFIPMFFLSVFLTIPLILTHNSRTMSYSGDCSSLDPEASFCIPYKNSSLISFIESQIQDIETCIDSLNSLISENKDAVVHFKNSVNSLFSSNFINTNQTILSYSTKKLVSNKRIERKFAFPELNPREFFYSELEFETSPHQFQEEFKFMHNMLFHFAFIDYYVLKEDLLCLSRQVEIPIITFTDYEIEYLLSPEIAHVNKEREIIRELYFYFKKIIGINYEVEQRKKLFFGESEMRLDDFVYLYSLIKSSLAVDRAQKFLVLPPLVHRIKNTMTPQNSLLLEFDWENSQLLIKSKGKVPGDTELFFMGIPLVNRNLFLYKNIIPEENNYNCFELEFFEEDLAKELHEPKSFCLPLIDLPRMRYWFVSGSIMNYKDEKSKKKCREYLQYTMTDANLHEIKLEDLMDGKYCKYVKWEKVDIWAHTKEALTEVVEIMKENVKVSKEYGEFREKEGVPKGNSELLRKYYEKNLEYLERLQEEIKFYEGINEERTRKTEL